MSVQIFLGQPPARIKQWMIDHPSVTEEPDPVDSSPWGKLVAALENCNPNDFTAMDYTGNDASLTSKTIGTGLTVKYKIDDINPVDTTWINLGYNASIPEYVKYRRAVGSGWKHVWIPSRKNELLAPIAVGDQVYVREFDETTQSHIWTSSEAETITAIDGTFTYGNNCTYDVPMSITTDKGEYMFCGYNITLNSQAILLLNAAGDKYICFDRQNNSTSNNRNIYDISRIRHWMNDLTCTDAAYRKGSSYALVDFLTLINKVRADEGLIRNIAPTVNRTWVHANHVAKATQVLDANSCEHLADKFWLLGCGHVNCTGINSSGTLVYNDANYDTSCFSSTFTPRNGYNVLNASRIKYVMTTTGAVGGSANNWLLRSAYQSYDDYVGYVNALGTVSSNSASIENGCLPAFQIG